MMAELPPQDDPLTAHVTAGGIVSTYRNADERKQRLEMKQAGDYIRAAKQQVADTTKDLASAEVRMRKAQANANKARQEAQMLYDQLVAEDEAERTVPNRHGVALARQRYDAAAYRMNHADAIAQREYSIVVWQQDRVTAAEQAVMKTEELERRVLEMEEAERAEMQQVAEYRGARELEAAEKVTILAVNPTKQGDHGDIPCADIALHLARHGIKAEATSTSADGIGVADAILARASDLGADLIVTGAYGHSRTREWVFGGVTESLVRHMTVPVMMSH